MAHSSHMEIAILGAMLLYPLAVVDATAQLTGSDFALDSHQRIYEVMAKMAAGQEHIDSLTVRDELIARKQLDTIGGPEYLAFLTEGIPRNLNIESYVRSVKSHSLARRAVATFQLGIQRLMEQEDAPESILDDVARVLTTDRTEASATGEQAIVSGLKRLAPGGYTRILTGIPEIDEMTYGGGRTKELWIIGAQPSAGKSALCRQIERRVVQDGFGVHAHSIEVDKETWMLQHAARLAGIPAWKLRRPELLSAMEKDFILGAAEKISRWNYRIDDVGSVSIETLLAKSRLSVMRHGTRVITVDYLQMLSGDKRFRTQEMSEAARKLKLFAKDYDCWVIALSQMARQGDINIRPTVQHLKESGDLEAAADVILMNFRPKNEAGEYSGEDEIIVGKQRNGSVGAIKQLFNSDKLEFEARAY